MQSHPRGLLFTKFRSNQMALLDLAFQGGVQKVENVEDVLELKKHLESFMEAQNREPAMIKDVLVGVHDNFINCIVPLKKPTEALHNTQIHASTQNPPNVSEHPTHSPPLHLPLPPSQAPPNPCGLPPLPTGAFLLQEEDLKQIRQRGSKTPDHPENFETPGVEVLLVRVLHVGLVLVEKHLAAHFNKPDA